MERGAVRRSDSCAEGAKDCQGPDRGEHIPQATMEIAVSAARIARGFRIKAHPPSPRVEALIAFRRSNANSIHLAHFAAQEQGCGAQRMIGQAERGRQVIATSCRNDAKNGLWRDLEGVQQKLECPVAADSKNARVSSASRLLCHVREVGWAAGDSQFDGPSMLCGKGLKGGQYLQAEAATGSGVNQEEVRPGGGGQGRTIAVVAGRSRQVNLQKGTKMVPAGGIEPTA